MSEKIGLSDVDVNGKNVLVRVDFNVPMDSNRIVDDTRIQSALPTILQLIAGGAKVILVTHLGRPKGFDNKFSTFPLAEQLSRLLGQRVKHTVDCIGVEVQAVVSELSAGDVLLLENVRFYEEETKNDPAFAEELASLADIYVSDAFGTAHRAHASTEGVTHYFDQNAAGSLMEQEIRYLSRIVNDPDRPFIAIIGGAKVSDKITVIENLINQVDELIIGGGMAYTFFKSKGMEIGKSIVELDMLDLAQDLLKKAENQGLTIHLPVDNVVGKEFAPDTESQIVKSSQIPRDWEGFDIGPETVEHFGKIVSSAQTVFWNGPVGVYEFDQFATGTIELAKRIAESNATSIIGGGDCVAAVHKAGVSTQITHISTGGGASLELIEGRILPGIAALTDKQ
ncbi:TPA: phosphoglycerate kinase [Candidatus Poribacteria bacterium]|nr:phosphoglycerate kinase [Candidatus Poribacteria bacterium]HIN30792.1 phosphoglycerate kinase [Candidatus Poribacteria bacterium]HIO46669.1 phosphoglycerate kinase [Candidatus Poribacteria bacterium]HIO76988.1 phosphoglycerate kinase [Candidatus Poribacteria bacterium]